MPMRILGGSGGIPYIYTLTAGAGGPGSALAMNAAKPVRGGSRPPWAEGPAHYFAAKRLGIAAIPAWAGPSLAWASTSPGGDAAITHDFAAKKPGTDPAPKRAKTDDENFASNLTVLASNQRGDASAQERALAALTRDAAIPE